jgi:ribosomal protein S18 acetylase RimI-like enzyme
VDINIKPLTPELLEDFLDYFDNVAFSNNPDWAICYCHFYHFAGSNKEFSNRTKEQNRNASKDLILAGKMNGFIAFQDKKPVGWCNANSKDNFAKIPYTTESIDLDKKIASIICFIIAPANRKKGIARKLLQYACSNLKNKVYNLIEAYPRKGDLSDAHSYRGPISLYTSEGFYIYKEFKDYYVMRKNL